MEFLGLLVPFLAAGGWLWWIYQADRLEREPWGLVLKTFGFGAAAGLVGLIGLVIMVAVLGGALGLVVLAPVNVALMTLVIHRVPFQTPDWNEPFDGLVYGGAAGIGYGLTYTLIALFDSPLTGFRTGIFSIPTFMLAGLIIGHHLSQVKFGAPTKRAAMWTRALVNPTLALAGVELARALGGNVMGVDNPVASSFVYGANTVGWILAMYAMDAKTRASQYNPDNYRLPLADTACPTCGSGHVAGAAFCNQCGQSLYTAWKGEQQV